jgi:hypothetical protein
MKNKILPKLLPLAQAGSLTLLAATNAFAQSNAFNPNISLVLDGAYAHYSHNPENYKIPGFNLGEEAEMRPEGFHIGESELQIDANVDHFFRAQANLAFGEEGSEVEQAFAETIGLSHGLSFKLGRFFSDTGYLNPQHAHAWQFADAPLVYRGLFGNKLKVEGAQANWLAPTDQFLLLGVEASNGEEYPFGGGHAIYSGFVKWGDDIGNNASWQLGAAYISADKVVEREAGEVEDSNGNAFNPTFSGESHIATVNAVYKWAPNGNFLNQNLTLQAEYFQRDEKGEQTGNDSTGTLATADNYRGSQSGWYAQGAYQFAPEWTVALRYDQLSSSAKADTNVSVLDESGLKANGHTPNRSSIALSWKPSEFSRIRVQYNDDHSQPTADQQLFVQYTYTLGTHAAHSY